MSVTGLASLPASLQTVLRRRGFTTEEAVEGLLSPSLAALGTPEIFSHMDVAVRRLLRALDQQEPIAIYADRDVDGLTGMAILTRSLRTLGAQVHWGSPIKRRGLDHAVLETLAAHHPKVMVLVDCGIGEDAELSYLASQGIDVIIADHHRLPVAEERAKALAYIHPGVMDQVSTETPAGCVMAFKLAQALWMSFLGRNDPERLNYFLFDHLDLLALGILADRVPVTGENRIFAWHGLRRLASTRKAGLAALLRFFRLLPRTTPVSVREASWQVIPLLNAAGRLGEPQWTGELLLTEDAFTARDCVDRLLELNRQRREHQDKSIEHFEKVVLEQCTLESDPILVAIAKDLEPSVTGLVAQALVRKYQRPAFLFVEQGEEAVGSGRGTDAMDLYALISRHKDLLVRFGGHHGAVGLTIRCSDYEIFRRRLLTPTGADRASGSSGVELSNVPEASLMLEEADSAWWSALQRLEPFGPGFPCPLFELRGIDRIEPVARPRRKTAAAKPTKKRSAPAVRLVSGEKTLPGEFEAEDALPLEGPLEGPWHVIGYPVADRKQSAGFRWVIHEIRRPHGQS